MWPFKKKQPKPEPKKLVFEMKGETADKFAVLYDAFHNRTGSSYAEGRAMWKYIQSVLPEEHNKLIPCTHKIVWKGVKPTIETTEDLE